MEIPQLSSLAKRFGMTQIQLGILAAMIVLACLVWCGIAYAVNSTLSSTVLPALAPVPTALTAIPTWTPTPTSSPPPPTPLPTRTPGEPMNAYDCWETYQALLGRIKARDTEGINSLLKNPVDWEKCGGTVSGKACTDLLLDTMSQLYSRIETLERADFTQVWADDRQLIMLSKPEATTTTGDDSVSKSYSQTALYFVRDSAGAIKVLGVGVKTWSAQASAGNEDELEKQLQDMMRDSDQDGLVDKDEICESAVSSCTPTDANSRDSDGDKYWDGVEVMAQTDPNDKSSNLD